MDRNTEKFVGYCLLILGLFIIIFSAYQVYIVFVGIANPPRVMNFEDITMQLPNIQGKVEIFASDILNKIGNLILWYLVMFFMVSCGHKIANLGIFLLRQIKVSVKAKEDISQDS
ncbi:MAG: hypothetical protein N2606_04585 [Candidatus Omnitrophica bacterium]|nr:hypothetical protein [Candidatus Omnitrophota bacterium]